MKYNINKTLFTSILICLSVLINTGCYSFKVVTIDPGVKTFAVEDFVNIATTVNPTLAQTLMEDLKDKIVSETRLQLVPVDGDIVFKGTIQNYFVEPAASGANDEAQLNRLKISVRVEYENYITDERWQQVFQQFEDFDRNANLSDIEDALVDNITENIIGDIFVKTFSNW